MKDRLLEVVEADRLDDNVPFTADDMLAVVDVEPLGRLRRGNVFRRLHDDRQTVDDHPSLDQRIAGFMKADDALIVITIARNIDDPPAAGKVLVELRAAECQRPAEKSVDPDIRA